MNAVQARDRQPPAQRFRQRAGLIFRNRDGPSYDLDIVGGQSDVSVDRQRPEITVGHARHSQSGVHESVARRFKACPRVGHARVLDLLFDSPIRHAQLLESAVEEAIYAATAGAALASLLARYGRHHLDVAAGERRRGQVRGAHVPGHVPAMLHGDHLGVQPRRASICARPGIVLLRVSRTILGFALGGIRQYEYLCPCGERRFGQLVELLLSAHQYPVVSAQAADRVGAPSG